VDISLVFDGFDLLQFVVVLFFFPETKRRLWKNYSKCRKSIES